MASGRAYAIRPYTGSQKINAFSRSIMYPVNFLGLGRGLDFLLPSFLVLIQEKKVGAWGQSPRFSDHKINIPRKRDTFSRSIMYPVNFLGLGRGLDFLLPSFLVSRQGPYRGREVFLGTFSRSIMYPVNFPGLGRGLDFLLPSFLVSRQEKKVGAWGQSPRFLYHKINIFGKCDPFSDY